MKNLGLSMVLCGVLLVGCGGNTNRTSSLNESQEQVEITKLSLTVGNTVIDSVTMLPRISLNIEEGAMFLGKVLTNKEARVSVEGKDSILFEIVESTDSMELRFKEEAIIGEYEVDIKASTEEQDVVYKINYIVNKKSLSEEILNIAPTVNAGDNVSLVEGQTVMLRGSATDSDGRIVSYEWKEGEAVLSTSASFEYTPSSVGTVVLKFSATDDDGMKVVDKITVTTTKFKPADILLSKVELIDSEGNLITDENRYEAGANIRVRMTVKNIGEGSVPEREEYYININFDNSHNRKIIAIPELKELASNESKTFEFNTEKEIDTSDNNKLMSLDLNINKSIFDDDFWKNNLFIEEDKSNNISEDLKIYVHQTDITIEELRVKVKNSENIVIRDSNVINISEDNIEGNYASYCCKVKNVGSHKFEDVFFSEDMLFNTEIIGVWTKMFNKVTLDVNEVSDEICVNVKLKEELVSGIYTFTLDARKYEDLETSNNIKSLIYTIED